MNAAKSGFDRHAAVTRSLLGWGVVAGPFYLVVGLTLALTRPGFDLSQHALSLLMLGEWGWMHRANVPLSALMVLAAAVGLSRAIRSGRGLAIAALTAVYGLGLILSAVFIPDPARGFPAGETGRMATTSGLLHLVFGALALLALTAAAFAYSGWCRRIGERRRATISALLGVIIVINFSLGAAFATSTIGIGALWLAVLGGWALLALASAHVYNWTPHPEVDQNESNVA